MITLACNRYCPSDRIWSEGPSCIVVADSGASDGNQLQINAFGMAHLLGPDEERRLLEYLIERAGGVQNLALEKVEKCIP